MPKSKHSEAPKMRLAVSRYRHLSKKTHETLRERLTALAREKPVWLSAAAGSAASRGQPGQSQTDWAGVLSVIDAFTRECRVPEVDTSFASRRVKRVLEKGPELTARHFLAWCIERRIDLLHIQPGRLMQTGKWKAFTADCATSVGI